MRLIAYGPDRYIDRIVPDLQPVQDALRQFPVTWIDMEGLGDGPLLEQLAAMFGLHSLAMEDVVHLHQRPKVEEYGEVVFIVLRVVSIEQRCVTEQISFFVGPNWLISLQEGQPGDPFNRVRERVMSNSIKLRTAGSDYLAYALIDALIDSYFPVLEEFADRLEVIEEECLLSKGDAVIDKLHQAKSDILLLRRTIWPQREAIASLMRDTIPCFTDATRVYLRDCYDHSVQLVELAELYRELIADLRDLHMSSLSNRINETMRVLTIISTLFIPLTFIAGIYGMNFDTRVSPYNMPELEWYYGYPLCLALMVLTIVGFLSFFIYKGWIGKRFFKTIIEPEHE